MDIFELIRQDDTERIAQYLERGDKLIRDAYDNTLIHAAVQHGRTHLVKLFIEKGIPINSLNSLGHSAFYEALTFSRIAPAKLLYKAGASIDCSQGGTTALILLCRFDINVDDWFFEEIFRSMEDINAHDCTGATALTSSITKLKLDKVAFLLQRGADPNTNKNAGSALSAAIEVFFRSLDKERDAVTLDMIRILADHNAKISIGRLMNLLNVHISGRGGYTYKTVKNFLLLLDRCKFDPDISEFRDINKIFYFHERFLEIGFDLKKFLLKNNVNINQKFLGGITMLHSIVLLLDVVNPDVLHFLFDLGANANIVDDIGDKPIHDAARKSDTETIKILIDYGANPFDKEGKGETAFDLLRDANGQFEEVEEYYRNSRGKRVGHWRKKDE